MTENPILFSGPMVLAILAGSKTQTRRVVKPQDVVEDPTEHDPSPYLHSPKCPGYCDYGCAGHACPYGQPGDRLWVRETWGLFDRHTGGGTKGYGVAWRATHPNLDDAVEWIDGPVDYGYPEAPAAPTLVPSDSWRPSIHMPRWACRLTLEVTSVRVERLHDISEDDAQAEGVEPVEGGGFRTYCPKRYAGRQALRADESFFTLWESINGAESLKANPWVWVVGFKRIDEVSRG